LGASTRVCIIGERWRMERAVCRRSLRSRGCPPSKRPKARRERSECGRGATQPYLVAVGRRALTRRGGDFGQTQCVKVFPMGSNHAQRLRKAADYRCRAGVACGQNRSGERTGRAARSRHVTIGISPRKRKAMKNGPSHAQLQSPSTGRDDSIDVMA
jgi:hypothetical protein